MTEERTFTEAAAHRFFAAQTFNQTWTYLENPARTAADDWQMLALAQASFYHWGVVGKPVNWGRAHWILSRVYAVLGRGAEAMAHGRQYLALVDEHSLFPFDRAYAYEAMARAAAVLGQAEEALQLAAQATEAGKAIVKDEDRELLHSDLATISVG